MELYLISNKELTGYEKVSSEVYHALFGNDTENDYAKQIYHGDMVIEDVPEEIRERVSILVNNRIERWGEFEKHEVAPNELKNMVEGVL